MSQDNITRAVLHPRSAPRTLVGLCVLLLCGLLCSGCGGGSSSSNNGGGGDPGNNGNGSTDTFISTVTGSVTDGNGAAIVGATVKVGDLTTTTSQFGVYSLPNVTIPQGQTSLITKITASATINSKSYTGSNTLEVLVNEPITRNVHIVLSNAAVQGSITGVVQDNQGHPLAGARVYASAPEPSGKPYFITLGSFAAYTAADGSYTIPNIEPIINNGAAAPYTVTASYAGHYNQTKNVVVVTGQTVTTPFTLSTTGTGSGDTTVSNMEAFSVTLPTVGFTTRASGGKMTAGALNAIRSFILSKKKHKNGRAAATAKVTTTRLGTRSTPTGTTIEANLLWDYDQLTDLLGYTVLRSDNTDTNFRSIALLRDPLATRYTDIDTLLTPDLNYYYSVARLDTINFPANGTEGTAGFVVVVRPLGPMNLAGPFNGSTQAGQPVFSWAVLPRATLYQILVYDRFPDYQSDTDANGVRPIWPADPNNPGASLVQVNSSFQSILPYQGPALQSGHTYYWTILASDDVGSAYSISPIYSFTVL